MVVKTPQYIVSAFKEECKILGIPEDFFIEVFTYREKPEIGSRGGFCKLVSKDGKKGVVIGIREEGNRGRTLGNLRHNMKHAQQFFTGDCSNPVYDELAAYVYEFRRGLKDKINWVYKKIINRIL